MTPPNDPNNGESSKNGSWSEYRRLVLSKLETLHEDQEKLNKKLTNLEAYLKKDFITKQYFDAVLGPIRNIVFGIVSIVCVSFLSAVIYLVITKGPMF